jgi:hypothetical protein
VLAEKFLEAAARARNSPSWMKPLACFGDPTPRWRYGFCQTWLLLQSPPPGQNNARGHGRGDDAVNDTCGLHHPRRYPLGVKGGSTLSLAASLR